MGEVGCSKDGSFQNLEVNGFASINNTKTMVQQKIIYSRLHLENNGEEKIFWLPPKSLIASIEIVVVGRPTIPSGKIGYKVGTAPNGDQLVAPIADQLLDGGTTITPGAYYNITHLLSTGTNANRLVSMIRGDTAISTNTSVAAVRVNTLDVPKPYYLKLTHTECPEAADKQGNFAWIVSYKQF
jgi:hypothetical protein